MTEVVNVGSQGRDVERAQSRGRTGCVEPGDEPLEVVAVLAARDGTPAETERRAKVRNRRPKVVLRLRVVNDGFDDGSGPNRVTDAEVTLLAGSLTTGSIRDCGSPWPGSAATPAPNRDLLEDSFNFDVPLAACAGAVRFHAFAGWRRYRASRRLSGDG